MGALGFQVRIIDYWYITIYLVFQGCACISRLESPSIATFSELIWSSDYRASGELLINTMGAVIVIYYGGILLQIVVIGL